MKSYTRSSLFVGKIALYRKHYILLNRISWCCLFILLSWNMRKIILDVEHYPEMNETIKNSVRIHLRRKSMNRSDAFDASVSQGILNFTPLNACLCFLFNENIYMQFFSSRKWCFVLVFQHAKWPIPWKSK